MNQITGNQLHANDTNNYNNSLHGIINNNKTNLPTYRPRPPRYPRDVSWSVAMFIFLTFSLLLLPPHLTYSSDGDLENVYYNWTSFHSNRNILLLFTTGTTLVISILLLGRTLYLSHGGGDGDDIRYRAGTLLILSNTFTWLLYAILALQVYWLEEDNVKKHQDDNGSSSSKMSGKTMLNMVLIFLLSMSIYELFVFSTRIFDATSSIAAHHHQQQNPSAPGTTPTIMSIGADNPLWNGRQVSFFRELVSTSLDILSRSLRFQSFYRVVCALVLLQFLLVWLWHHALVAVVLGKTSVTTHADGSTTRSGGGFVLSWMVLMVCIGGWWGSNVIRRILGLIASGGVTAWFAQQSLLLEEMEQMKSSSRASAGLGDENDSAGASSVSSLGGEGAAAAVSSKDNSLNPAMPEAYRVDASAYSSAIEFDEGIDDDYEDDGYFNGMTRGNRDTLVSEDGKGLGSNPALQRRQGATWTGGGSGGSSTVKSFLISAVTTSLGSVSKCALLGGLAQTVWWAIHKLDYARSLFSRRFSSSPRRQSGFEGMNVGTEQFTTFGDENRLREFRRRSLEFMTDVEFKSKKFAKNNSELALCHVAAYFKSYQKAAYDVMQLIDAAGVEPIIFDDISTHMCSSISKSITAFLTILSGQFLLNVRSEQLSDVTVCEIMIISYIMCYTILFTLMEPLRAGIQAVYVCFAQHPQSLSQAFPLVYHRLSRISEDNIV